MSYSRFALNLDYFIDSSQVPQGEALYSYWTEAGAATAELGFAGVMTCGPEPNTPEWRENLSRVLERSQLRLVQLHAPWDPWSGQLAATDEGSSGSAVELYRQWLHYAGELNAEELVIHPPPHIPEHLPRNQAVENCARCLRQIMDAAPPGLRVTVENVVWQGEGQPFGGSTETVAAVIRSVGDTRLGFCLDTSHIVVERLQPWLVVPGLADCLSSVHMHDVDHMGPPDAHLMPGAGLVDWRRLFEALEQIRYAGPLIYELNSQGTWQERKQRIKENSKWIVSML